MKIVIHEKKVIYLKMTNRQVHKVFQQKRFRQNILDILFKLVIFHFVKKNKILKNIYIFGNRSNDIFYKTPQKKKSGDVLKIKSFFCEKS